MNDIKGFTFYKSYYESLKNLKEKDKKDVINAILEYIFEDKMPNFTGIKKAIWALILPNLNTSKNRSNPYSGAPYGNQNATKEKQSKNNQKTTSHLYDKDKDKDKEIDKDKDKEEDNITTKSTAAPTPSIIISFGKKMGVDEQYCKEFFDYYETHNWLNNKGEKIDSWEKVFRNWLRQDRNKIKGEKLPEWWGKDIKKGEATQEEIDEMKRLLEGYK